MSLELSGSRLKYLNQLDGLRAIAVAFVLFDHCVKVPDSGVVAWGLLHVLSKGWIGVDIFFVLSGFLITRILFASKEDAGYFRSFYLRRFVRIFPPYYFLIFVLVAFGSGFQLAPTGPVWPYLTYTSNISILVGGYDWEPMGHAWSLAVEEQFYLVFPLLVWVMDLKKLKRVLWAVIVLAPFVRLVCNLEGFRGASYFATVCRMDALAMGALISVYYADGWLPSRGWTRTSKGCLLLLLASLAVMWVTKLVDFRSNFFVLFGVTVVDASCAILLVLLVEEAVPRLVRVLRNGAVVGAGKISYGIYLYHYPIMVLIDRISVDQFGSTWCRTFFTATVSIGLSIAFAAASWQLLEKPILSRKDRMTRWATQA